MYTSRVSWITQDNSDVAFSFTHLLETQFVPTQTRHKLKCVDTDGASTSGLHPVWSEQNYRFIMDSKQVATRVRRDKHVSFREASIFMDYCVRAQYNKSSCLIDVTVFALTSSENHVGGELCINTGETWWTFNLHPPGTPSRSELRIIEMSALSLH